MQNSTASAWAQSKVPALPRYTSPQIMTSKMHLTTLVIMAIFHSIYSSNSWCPTILSLSLWSHHDTIRPKFSVVISGYLAFPMHLLSLNLATCTLSATVPLHIYVKPHFRSCLLDIVVLTLVYIIWRYRLSQLYHYYHSSLGIRSWVFCSLRNGSWRHCY